MKKLGRLWLFEILVDKVRWKEIMVLDKLIFEVLCYYGDIVLEYLWMLGCIRVYEFLWNECFDYREDCIFIDFNNLINYFYDMIDYGRKF